MPVPALLLSEIGAETVSLTGKPLLLILQVVSMIESEERIIEIEEGLD